MNSCRVEVCVGAFFFVPYCVHNVRLGKYDYTSIQFRAAHIAKKTKKKRRSYITDLGTR
jgi:hypothetical protein